MYKILLLLLFFSTSALAQSEYIPEQSNLNSEELCLVQTIYFEARGESFVGQLAVGSVVMKRLSSNSYPDTICGVVRSGVYWKGNPVKDKCAFSYWCDGKSEKMYDIMAYDDAVTVANMILSGARIETIKSATHYHAVYVEPSWSFKLKRITRIGKHIFYRR
jgi:spore germination cell wall hydrolase CwlJ-like protein|tara:strand:- start:489 stop:974 length:486 start_codon:yes stop_codon:yes gene_type:complete